MVKANEIGYAYGVNPAVIKKVVKCESNWRPGIQSTIVSNGVRERSYGLVQIHIPSHPHITIEEAKNPDFALQFIAQEMSEGNARKWTCWRNLPTNLKSGTLL